jgi:predicted transcriptional regulator
MTSAPVVSVADEQLAEVEDGYYESIKCPFNSLSDYATELRRLRAENEALMVDAGRYRWLRDPDIDVALVIDKRTEYVEADDSVSGVGGYFIYEYRAGEELDTAIDTAMQSSTEGN